MCSNFRVVNKDKAMTLSFSNCSLFLIFLNGDIRIWTWMRVKIFWPAVEITFMIFLLFLTTPGLVRGLQMCLELLFLCPSHKPVLGQFPTQSLSLLGMTMFVCPVLGLPLSSLFSLLTEAWWPARGAPPGTYMWQTIGFPPSLWLSYRPILVTLVPTLRVFANHVSQSLLQPHQTASWSVYILPPPASGPSCVALST